MRLQLPGWPRAAHKLRWRSLIEQQGLSLGGAVTGVPASISSSTAAAAPTPRRIATESSGELGSAAAPTPRRIATESSGELGRQLWLKVTVTDCTAMRGAVE